MTRTIAITGSAAGIGLATAMRLRAAGDRVIGIDRHDADIVADLATPEGCAAMAAAVTERADGRLDGVIANAGVLGPDALCHAVNYHGAVVTLTLLRPLLARSPAPRALVTASMAAAISADPGMTEAVERGERPESATNGAAYSASKRAIALWVRRMAATAEWGGQRILLNAVGPGLVRTPMGELALADPAAQALVGAAPLGRIAEPDEIAALFAFLVSADNSFMTGQVIYADGGVEASLRPRHC